MQFLGTIVQLHYQRDHLKVPGPRYLRYDPVNIVPVDALQVTSAGIESVDGPASWVDVHHRDHPRSRFRGDNGISIGFTGHYRMLRERFGARLSDGVAGENLLIDADRRVHPEELTGGLVIVGADGETCRLVDIIIATPCVEFSRWALDFPPDAPPDRQVTETVRFLHQGVRGYYARCETTGVVQTGDRVYLPSP